MNDYPRHEETRLAIVVSHPIQHFCPQYSSWASLSRLNLKVFFASQGGLKPYIDASFGRTIQWDGLSLRFPHEFLPGAETRTISPSIDASPEAHLSLFSPSVLLVHGYAQPLQRRALKWATSTGTQVFMIGDSELHSSRSSLRRHLKALILPRMFKKVDRFLTVGDSNEAYYRSYGVRDNHMIRTCFPIDIEHYDQVLKGRLEARARVRTAHNVPLDHTVVMMVGKFTSWKRQSDLVAYSNTLQRDRSNVTIMLVGSGPEDSRLRALARRLGPGGIVFAGFVPPSQLAAYYCASDIYVHCSSHEPHSLAVSEAIYCGLPVVMSDRCGSYGPTDDVRVGLNGLVYVWGYRRACYCSFVAR